jgi:hypothetical protein
MTPSEIGAVAEAEVARALRLAGVDVYVPLFNPAGRVDLVVDGPDGLHRVQCKTSSRRGDVIIFRTCSNTGNLPLDYRGEVDAFGVWPPDLEQAFLVPAELLGTRTCSLRLGPAANGQSKGVRWAQDHLIGGDPPFRSPRSPGGWER